jgi:hypothetical protein
MAITEIKEGELVLARLIPAADAWGDGLKFFSSDGDYQQVGTWGYNKGKILMTHSHNKVSREVMWTQEVLYVRAGRLRAQVFDTLDQKVADLDASAGDLLILLLGGHGYQILEDGTEVLEIKNGPYLGPETDRRRFI